MAEHPQLGDAVAMQAEHTGQGMPMPPGYVQLTQGRWLLIPPQWLIVCWAVLRAMFKSGPPNENDNVPPTEVDPFGNPRFIDEPRVVADSAKLVNALMKDPYKVYGAVPWAAKINWANYSCLGAWFHSLSDAGRQMFVNDVFMGKVDAWIPAVRNIAMAACPVQAYSYPYTSALNIVHSDIIPPAWQDYGWTDDHLVWHVFERASVGTPWEGGKSFVPTQGLPTFPTNLTCQPFPACLLENLIGTSQAPAQVAPSGNVLYAQSSEYESAGDAVLPPKEDKVDVATPYNWFLGPVLSIVGAGTLYGIARLAGAGTTARVVAAGAGAVAGAVVGGRV